MQHECSGMALRAPHDGNNTHVTHLVFEIFREVIDHFFDVGKSKIVMDDSLAEYKKRRS